MAVTTTFSWEDGANVFLNNAFTAGSQNQPAIIANFSADRYFGAWSDPAFANQVEGRLINADQSNITDEFTVNNPATNAGFSQFDPRDGAKVVDGPAPRPLPALPITVADGVLVVAQPFTAPITFEKG